MASWKINYRVLGRVAETMIVAIAGALLFTWIRFPAALICGSTLAVALAALAGRPVTVPAPLARFLFILIGITLGSVVTPETLHGVVDWPISIALISVSAICMTFATMSYLRYVHRWDPLSALYGGSPGGQAQVMMMATQYGADVPGIAIVQSVRVVFLAVGVPGALALFGLAGSPVPGLGIPDFAASPLQVVVLVVASTVSGLLFQRLRIPGNLVLGAMLASGILHGGGFIHAALPWWVVSAGVVALGGVVGSRFANPPPRLLFAYLGAAVGSFAVALATATAFALIVASLSPTRIADLVVAFSPGAQDTMMVLALSLNIDPVFVGAHQLARYLVVSLSLPLIAHFMMRNRDKANEKKDDEPPKD